MADILPQSVPPGGDESLQWIIYGVGVLWNCTWSLAFTILRILVRTRTGIKLWWDDYFIMGAAFGELAGTILVIVEVQLGFGRHQYYLSMWQIVYYLKLDYVEWIQTFFTLMCTKVSIAFFLLRIPIQKKHIFPLYASIAFLIVSNLVLTLMWIFQCWPVEAVWDPTVKAQHCFDSGTVANIILAQGIIAAISDFAFALYPILILYHLKMSSKDKVGLCVLMGLGLITGACCVVRMTWNWQAVPRDLTYGGMTNYVWRNLEIGLGISLASVPPLVPGYKWLKRKLKHSWSSTFGGTTLRDTLPFTPNHATYKRKASDVTELLRDITTHQSVLTAVSGPKREEGEGTPPMNGDAGTEAMQHAILKITQVDVEFENRRQREGSNANVEKGLLELPERGGTRREETSASSNFGRAAIASEIPSETPNPSLGIDLRPSFVENREVFEDMLEEGRFHGGNNVWKGDRRSV